jgi:hypothetical protein
VARVKTFTNGGSLLPSDLDSIEDDYELAFRAYREVHAVNGRLDAATASTRLLGTGVIPAVAVGNAQDGLAAIYIDPARWDASVPVADPRSVYYNLVFSTITNGVAPTVALTAGLYVVTASAGAAANVTLTLNGTPVAGSTAASAAGQALDTQAQVSSGDFAAPAAGYYAIAVVVATGGMAASSSVAVRATLLATRY